MTATLTMVQSGPSQREEQWQSALQLARIMRQEARSGEWQNVMERESQRQKILLAYFSSQPSPDESQDIAAGIHEILEIDKEIFSLSKLHMDSLSSQLSSIRKSSKAASIYTSNKS